MTGCMGLLFVLAHPDDETFLAGGTIAKYAQSGVRVSILCATRGERGATGDLCSVDDLPVQRESELREAARILGAGVELLGYVDQQLGTAPVDEIRRKIVQSIRRERPEIVVTFDPNGGNLHTDHIAISRFAVDALVAAADRRWYPEAGEAHFVRRLLWTPPVPVFELGRTPDPGGQPGMDFLIEVTSFREKKEAALRAHRTQWPGLHKIFFEKGRPEESLRYEAFRLARGPRPSKTPAGDLFAD